MGAVAPLATAARPFIATSTAAPGFPALQTTALAHGARLISVGDHGGGFYFHRSYIFCGAHDYARASGCYHYRYTGDADNCHGGGGEETSAPNV